MAIDIVAPPGKLIESIEIFILPRSNGVGTDEGNRNHLEFCTEAIRMKLSNEYDPGPNLDHRGVFGYVAFGLGGITLPDGGTEFPRWLEGRFINWCGNLFKPQDGVLKENARIWLRFGVRANIGVSYSEPAGIIGQVLPIRAP